MRCWPGGVPIQRSARSARRRCGARPLSSTGGCRPEEEDLEAALATFGFESEAAPVPQLDLATLEAQAPEMTVQAKRVANAFVGEVNGEVFIAVVPDELPAGDSSEVMVYLCDDEGLAAVMTGSLADDGTATLCEGGAVVELTVDENQIAGTATLDGEEIVCIGISRN